MICTIIWIYDFQCSYLTSRKAASVFRAACFYFKQFTLKLFIHFTNELPRTLYTYIHIYLYMNIPISHSIKKSICYCLIQWTLNSKRKVNVNYRLCAEKRRDFMQLNVSKKIWLTHIFFIFNTKDFEGILFYLWYFLLLIEY